MKKIFLSLGFSGRDEKDVRRDIDNAKQYIASLYGNEEVEFIHNYDYIGNNRVECLGEAIKKMSTCDIVFFIGNIINHKGCLIERSICLGYGIPHQSIII